MSNSAALINSSTIAARLERLRFNGWHARLIPIIGTAHIFGSFDALLIGFIAPVLAKLWHLQPLQIGILFSLGYVGQFIGALGIGRLADTRGRRGALRAALLMLSLFSLACAAAPNFEVLLVLRFLQGIALGGEVPVAATYVNEVSPVKSRGRLVYALQTLFTSGSLLAALVSSWLLPGLGWRAMFVVGALPLFMALFLPWLIPESPRWLAANNRLDEADAAVRKIEAAAKGPLPPVTAGPAVMQRRTGFADLLRNGYARRSLSLWLMMLCAALMGIGITTWLPTLYTKTFGLPLAVALRYTSVAAGGAVAGSVLGFLLIDLIGRRPTFLIAFAGGSASLLVLAFIGNAATAQTVMVLATIAMLMSTILLNGAYIYAPEIFPTAMRATAAGAASSCLRLGAIVGPLVVGWLLTHAGMAAVFLFFGLSGVVGGVTTFLFAIETKGRPLEEALNRNSVSDDIHASVPIFVGKP